VYLTYKEMSERLIGMNLWRSSVDRIDWKIANALEEDGRMSFADLAEQVGVSKSPCWNRVRELRKNGVITGFGVKLDPSALGLGVQCFISITISYEAHSDFEAAVCEHPAIIECHTTAGSSDYLLRLYARSVEQLDELLRHEISKLPGVKGTTTTICLKTIKQNGSLAKLSASLPARALR
jgi:Lrp/AsnC family transcriptional regulator, leucine-responsive regulatory protein